MGDGVLHQSHATRRGGKVSARGGSGRTERGNRRLGAVQFLAKKRARFPEDRALLGLRERTRKSFWYGRAAPRRQTGPCSLAGRPHVLPFKFRQSLEQRYPRCCHEDVKPLSPT